MDTIIRDGPSLPDSSGSKSAIGRRLRRILFQIRSDHFHIKAYYFCFYGGLGSLVPYLSVYFKQLGLEPDQIGLLHGFKPVVGFCGALLMGNLADTFRIRRYLFLSSILCWIGFYVIIALLPPAGRAQVCPTTAPPKFEVAMSQRSDIAPADPLDDRIFVAPPPEDGERLSLFSLNQTRNSEIARFQERRSWIYDQQDLHKLFISILTFVVLGEIFHSPTSALADAGTLEQIGKDRVNEYGRHRAWGSVGLGVCSFIVGVVISNTRYTKQICGISLSYAEYTFPFCSFSVMMLLAFIAATRFKFQEEESGIKHTLVKHNPMNVCVLFCSLHHVSWLMSVIFMGVSNGTLIGFLFWHLENIGASQTLMGLASVTSCSAEFFTCYSSHKIIRRLGYMNVLRVALVAFAIRFTTYASVTDPWFVLPAEVLQGMIMGSVWATITSYSATIVPRESLASLQGIMHGVYWGVGAGSGYMIGGHLIKNYGAIFTFRSFAVMSVAVLILFSITQKISEGRRRNSVKIAV